LRAIALTPETHKYNNLKALNCRRHRCHRFLAWYGSYLSFKERIDEKRWMLWAIFLGFPLPWIAILTGWFTAEVGRQPWTVYGVLRTAGAMTPFLTVRVATISLVLFCAVYSFIFSFGIYYIYRLLRAGPAGRLIEPAVGAVPNRPMSVVPSESGRRPSNCGPTKSPQVMQMVISKVTPRPVVAVSIDAANPSLREDGNPSALAIKLLDTAADVVQYDPAAAIAYIVRATDLLRADLGASDHQLDGATAGSVRGGLAPWQIRRVTAHIDTAMGSTIRLRNCAKIARLSTSYFARAFRVSFGETFARHVIARRTERAQQMMLCTNDPLSQIAVACGFADQAHFTRVFRYRTGISPAAWRRERHAGPLSTCDAPQPRAFAEAWLPRIRFFRITARHSLASLKQTPENGWPRAQVLHTCIPQEVTQALISLDRCPDPCALLSTSRFCDRAPTKCKITE
jgi:AraC-like DNA-binding protein